VLSNKDDFEKRCNTQMVGIEALSEEQDISELEELIRNHGLLTGSPIAELLLEQWERASSLFVKVVPHEYKRVLERGRVITEMTTTQSI
jgi:glutamate synthase domain-containing protein 3